MGKCGTTANKKECELFVAREELMFKSNENPVIIKSYAGKKLYDTERADYISMPELADIAKSDRDFFVLDAQSGKDVTLSVLKQMLAQVR